MLGNELIIIDNIPWFSWRLGRHLLAYTAKKLQLIVRITIAFPDRQWPKNKTNNKAAHVPTRNWVRLLRRSASTRS